jgi:hypothetical protein
MVDRYIDMASSTRVAGNIADRLAKKKSSFAKSSDEKSRQRGSKLLAQRCPGDNADCTIARAIFMLNREYMGDILEEEDYLS